MAYSPTPEQRAHSSAVQRALHEERTQQLSELVPVNRSPGQPSHITTEQIDEVLDRVASGQLITQACNAMGIKSSLIRQRKHDNEEFRARITLAQELGRDALVDALLAIHADQSLSIKERELACKNLRWAIPRMLNAGYADRVDHNVNVAHVPFILPRDSDF